jgi:mono/diheme cytochrome c family protein
MPVRVRAAALCLLTVGLAFALVTPSNRAVGDEKKPADSKVSFAKDVQPILTNNCGKCHNSTKAKKGIDVTSYDTTMKIVKAGKPDDSRLLKSLTGTGAKQMPPKNPLADEQIARVKAWIAGGAKNN